MVVEMTRLEQAKHYFNKNYTKEKAFEVLQNVFNKIFEGQPTKQENKWLKKMNKESGLKEQWDLEDAFLATECF